MQSEPTAAACSTACRLYGISNLLTLQCHTVMHVVHFWQRFNQQFCAGFSVACGSWAVHWTVSEVLSKVPGERALPSAIHVQELFRIPSGFGYLCKRSTLYHRLSLTCCMAWGDLNLSLSCFSLPSVLVSSDSQYFLKRSKWRCHWM